jgi:hypothetical protein
MACSDKAWLSNTRHFCFVMHDGLALDPGHGVAHDARPTARAAIINIRNMSFFPECNHYA